MRILVALGGNALLERGERPDEAVQRRHVRRAAEALAPLAADHELVVCHGNGPQVGLLALESEADPALAGPYPLDVLGAETQGMIGYWLVQELANAGVRRPVVGVLTQTVVDPADPGFAAPSKFVGRGYDRGTAEDLAARLGWRIAPDGAAWRRVVASPQPLRVVEQGPIRQLVDGGAVVVCGGGGGVPVTVRDGRLCGVEAVVDKDATAALLARELGADRLLLLTDVPAVLRGFGTPGATEIRRLTDDDAAALPLPAGSMGPKLAACAAFARATGRPAAIGALTDAAAVLAGAAGTTVVRAQDRRGRVLRP
ncbi:carbamate kinase [Blastococcus sp. TF02A-30]|uniref:carbamate kinase n=1 Tax=Blastococcus sp. TF02A-30 TaxID=2250580 RepID=UPI000DE8CCDE|nr:carbamate kinase [Blastococcus sp. TF02A-30]RBY87748.1 carbamate kinase [Blastococcus sp. TF02A-30]